MDTCPARRYARRTGHGRAGGLRARSPERRPGASPTPREGEAEAGGEGGSRRQRPSKGPGEAMGRGRRGGARPGGARGKRPAARVRPSCARGESGSRRWCVGPRLPGLDSKPPAAARTEPAVPPIAVDTIASLRCRPARDGSLSDSRREARPSPDQGFRTAIFAVSAAEVPPGFASGSRCQATDIPAGRPAYPPRPSNQAGNHSAICGKARISARPKSWMTMNCIIPK